MQTHTKRFKAITQEEANKGRQLSGLFNIIGSNLLLASEVLSPESKIRAVSELESLSRKARLLAKELLSDSKALSKEEITEKISHLKQKMLKLVISLLDELNKLDSNTSSDEKTVEDIILVKRLLRDSQRGLATIQD